MSLSVIPMSDPTLEDALNEIKPGSRLEIWCARTRDVSGYVDAACRANARTVRTVREKNHWRIRIQMDERDDSDG